MIRSFASRDTERFFHGGTVPAFQGFTRQARQKLNDLDEAASLTALLSGQAITWNLFLATGGDSTASESTGSGAFASAG